MIFIRTSIIFIALLAIMRMMGKRQIGELEPGDLVLTMMISDLAAVPMQDFGIPLLMGVIPILTLLCLSTILSVAAARNIRFRAFLCSRPSIVVEDGRILSREMEKNRFTVDELMEELRVAGVTDISSVKYAVLETTGRISVLPKAEQKPVTPQDMGLPAEETGLPVIVVSDGRLMSQNLKNRGLNENWVKNQLKKRGISDVRNVFLMTVNEAEGIYLCLREDAK